MKKLFTTVLLTLLALSLVLCAASCKKDDGIPEGMKNVATERAQTYFDLFVPETWMAQTDSGISGARVSQTDSANVTATLYFPGTVMTAESYWTEFCLPEYQNGVLKDFSIVADACKDTTLGGKNAKQYVFVYTVGETVYESMQIITVHDNMVFTLTYTAESANYATHLETVESIRAEFRLK